MSLSLFNSVLLSGEHEILYTIREYLGKDVNKLLITCTEFYRFVTKFRFIFLNEYNSIRYCEDNHFRAKISTLIVSPRRQLGINLLRCIQLKKEYVPMLINVYKLELNLERKHIDKIFIFKNSTYLTLRNINRTREDHTLDLTPLSNVVKLDLSGSNIIDNLSVFASFNLYSVNLSNCPNIVDVSPLAKIPEINLSGCINVRDVSMLGKAKKLLLYKCSKIRDVSMLNRVKFLDISYCSSIDQIFQISYNKILTYAGCRIEYINITFEQCHEIILSFSPNTKSILIDGNINILNIANMQSLTYLSLNGNINNVNVVTCTKLKILDIDANINYIKLNNTKISNISCLSNINDVVIRKCGYIKNFSYLSNCKSVIISECINLTDTNWCSNIEKLSLNFNFNITKMNSPVDADNVYLSGCKKLIDVSALGNIRDLDLSECTKLSNITTLTNNEILNLSKCTMIKDFSNLRLSHNLHTINLSYTKIKNEDLIYLEYMNIHELDISHCVNISNISTLDKLPKLFKLNIGYLRKIINVSHLYKVNTLILSHCSNVKDISALSNVTNLNLYSCPKIKFENYIPNNDTINISRCNIKNIMQFVNIRKVIICIHDKTNIENFTEFELERRMYSDKVIEYVF